MNALLVYAHEEPQSFNGALRDTAISVLNESGHTVEVSDLYAMNFDPVGGRKDFTKLADSKFFKYGVEQAAASANDTFANDVADEQEKLFRADLLIFQFPLWWFGLPAILKGWVDRVFAAGMTYDRDRLYSRGVFQGKRAMLSLTTGSPPSYYSSRGVNGDMDSLLFPIQHGILYFVGFDVLPPFIAYSVARSTSSQRLGYLEEYASRLRKWSFSEPILFPRLEEYDETMQLKASPEKWERSAIRSARRRLPR